MADVISGLGGRDRLTRSSVGYSPVLCGFMQPGFPSFATRFTRLPFLRGSELLEATLGHKEVDGVSYNAACIETC